MSLFWGVCLISDFFLSCVSKHAGWFECSMYLGAIKSMETGQSNISYALRALPIDSLNETHDQYINDACPGRIRQLENRILVLSYGYCDVDYRVVRGSVVSIHSINKGIVECSYPSRHN